MFDSESGILYSNPGVFDSESGILYSNPGVFIKLLRFREVHQNSGGDAGKQFSLKCQQQFACVCVWKKKM